MLSVLTVLATVLAVTHGLVVRVTMPSGKKVEVDVDPKKTTVKEFRKLIKEAADTGDKLYSSVVSLCNPHRFFNIDPTPILPMDNDKTLYEQGVYSLFSRPVELPQSFFAFEDVASKTSIVLTGCEWSTPDEVLTFSKMPYREYKSNLNQRIPPPTKGKNANAFETLELAQNAHKKVPVVSDNYCSFTVQYTPTDHVTSIFPCQPTSTTVADLKKAMQAAVRQDRKDNELLAASVVLCKEKATQGDCTLKESETLAQAFGEKTLDLIFPSPASFVRVLVKDEHFDVPVCPAMTVSDLQSQIIARLGLKSGTKVTFKQAELAGNIKIPINELYLSSFMFHAKRNPVYLIRLHEFDQSDYAVILPNGDNQPSPIEEVITSGGRLFKDRRVLIAIVVLVGGAILITFGIMSSSSSQDDDVIDTINPSDKPDDHLPTLVEPSTYQLGAEREALSEVNFAQPADPQLKTTGDDTVFEVEPLPSVGVQAFEADESPVPHVLNYPPTNLPAVPTTNHGDVNIPAPKSPPLPISRDDDANQ